MKMGIAKKILYYLVLSLFFILLMFPIYFIVLISLKHESDVFVRPMQYIANPATLRNYVLVWRESNFVVYFLNSVFVSLITMASIMVFSIMTGYCLSRYQFKGKTVVILVMLTAQMVPSVATLIPVFIIFRDIGLLNSLWALIITATVSSLPYCTIMAKGFFATVSVQLEEAARIDGCNRFTGVIRVVVPVMLPGIVAIGAFAFVNAWNSYLMPLMLLNSPSKNTLTIGLRLLIGQYNINYTRMASAGVICLIPAVCMFAYMQKYMVSGLTAGAVKG